MQTKLFTVKEHGLHGHLYIPETEQFNGKAMILIGGSDGLFSLSCVLAEKYCTQGLTVMAAAYFNAPGLPESLHGIPVEYIGNVALFLRGLGYGQIGVWGISMGSELALLAGCYFPDLISCVVACAPICIATQGLNKTKSECMEGSAFTWNGQDIPYMRYMTSRFGRRKKIREMLAARGLSMRFVYDGLFKNLDADAMIPVERMKAALLMFSGKMDTMWPAYEAGEIIMERLDQNKYPYPHRHIVYEHGSHYMVPMPLNTDFIFYAERKYKAENRRNKEKIMEKTMQFLHEEWR